MLTARDLDRLVLGPSGSLSAARINAPVIMPYLRRRGYIVRRTIVGWLSDLHGFVPAEADRGRNHRPAPSLCYGRIDLFEWLPAGEIG